MYCDECTAALDIDLATYIKTKERLGTALCGRCQNDAVDAATDLLSPPLRG